MHESLEELCPGSQVKVLGQGTVVLAMLGESLNGLNGHSYT